MAAKIILERLGRPVFYLLLYFLTFLFYLFTAIGKSIIGLLRFITLKGRKTYLISFFLLGFLLFTFYFFILKDLPVPDRLITREIAQTTKIYDRHGNLLYKIYHNQNRTLMPLEEIPLFVQQATIAVEDGSFYQHRGISFIGVARALYQFLFHGQVQGGSTITQQLVKNALLTPEQTLNRKIKEMILAVLVELRFSKEEILKMYLNEVSYGGAAYGIEEASQLYFGKSVCGLTLSEAALLAGLPASPTTYSPFGAHPELSKKRQETVLQQMVKKNFITKETAQKTKAEELHFTNRRENILAPHFVMYVKEQLVDMFSQRYIEEGGLQVTTTLDLSTQELAEEAVRDEIARLRNLRVRNGAALVTNPQTGEILAMVGSSDYFDQDNEGNFNVTTALRQPGSAIKVINYAVALQNGFTLSSIIPDTPIVYQISGQPPYSPKNYDNRFHGNVTLRTALASSYNVPAVKVLAALGMNRMVEMGRLMGITTWEDSSRYGLSLTLGGGEVRMTDMAVAYGTLANLGKKVGLQSILQVADHKGKILWSRTESQKQVIPSGIAFLLTDVLSDNQARAPAFGLNSVLDIPEQKVAVKTGTSNNLRDNWTIGYTPSRLVAVWVGNNDNSPMSQVASGITGASPIWRRIMEELLEKQPKENFLLPTDIVEAVVCSATGTLSCSQCPNPRREYFLKGTVPTKNCEGMFKKKEKEEYPKILP